MTAEKLYATIVATARQPKFYRDDAVPDTIEGRFEMIILHMYLVLQRMNDSEAATIRQALTDCFFRDMDNSLREFGVSDVAVGKKVRKLEEHYYGRLLAYDKAVSQSHSAVQLCLQRNLYAGVETGLAAENMAKYLLHSQSHLAALPMRDILDNRFTFS